MVRRLQMQYYGSRTAEQLLRLLGLILFQQLQILTVDYLRDLLPLLLFDFGLQVIKMKI